MELELNRGGCRARIATLGGELVSYRDEEGREYIWNGDPAYWSGRNPLLFPIVGGLRDGKVMADGRVCAMARHGVARRQEFTVAEAGADWARLELRENARTLEQYPFPFRLQVLQRLEERGFSTAVTVCNTGAETMPFCLGAHTAFRCPLAEGERFEDYAIEFEQREDCPTLVPVEGTLDRARARPCLEESDRLELCYRYFDEMDTLIFEGLRSRWVCLRGGKSGRGVRMHFDDFPVLALWSAPGKQAPYLCIEPWHGLPPVAGEGPQFRDKAYCILLAPGEERTLRYRVETL